MVRPAKSGSGGLSRGLLALALAALANLPSAARSDPAAAPTGACAGLLHLAIADVTVRSAVSEGATCRVQGVIEKEIGFEMLLPAAWNGRFLAAGVGGQAGQPNRIEIARAAARGYAAASTDAGHLASDRHWLLGSPERAANYAWRANHLLADKAKAITAAFYGRRPERSVFVGCSGGGRQALTEVERFPDDYDAVIAGAPGTNTPEMSARRMWEMVQHSAAKGLMTQADWNRIAAAAVEACDADDGLKDGVITDPRTCRFRPRDLLCRTPAKAGCLSPGQVALAEKIYAPLKDEHGRVIDRGLLPGVPVAQALAPEPFTPGPPYIAVALFADGVHKNPDWDAKTFRIADDLPAIDRVMDLHADNPDLSAFKARGGKLIVFQGWADPLVAAQPTIDWFQAVEHRMGGPRATRDFARMFMVPGMGHCVGGDATDRFGAVGSDGTSRDPDHDMLSALERWMDGGPGPERLVAAKVRDGRLLRTRPLCAWPLEARWSGRGDADRAESFTCALPRKGRRT